MSFPGDNDVFARHIHEHPIISHHEHVGDHPALKISDFLSQDGKVQLATEQARQRLAACFGGSLLPTNRLPATLASWARKQLLRFGGQRELPPPLEPLVVEREGARLVVRFLYGHSAGEQRVSSCTSSRRASPWRPWRPSS